MLNFSSNWEGSCNLIKKFNAFNSYYSSNINSLEATIDIKSCSLDSICHKNTKNYYEITKQKIEQLKIISPIYSERPSGLPGSLIPSFEKEFSDLSNIETYGGKIYAYFTNILLSDMEKMDEIQKKINNYISNTNLQKEMSNAYAYIIKFDKTIASAASIMLSNFLGDKKLILNCYNFMFLFINFAFLIVWICIIVFIIIYECKKYRCIFYFLIAFINVFAFLSIWNVVLSALIQGIRLFCRETPRVMNFIFTEDYMLNGNTENYPPKFGDKDKIIPELFSICLNGDGDLLQKFISKQMLNSILSQTESLKKQVIDLLNIIDNQIQSTHIKTNLYDTLIIYSSIYSSIIKLEEMSDDLYSVSGLFEDNIEDIIYFIRQNLDSPYCGKYYEYFVIKKSDCPPYSIILNQITYSDDHIYHCYIIQDLLSSSKANYQGEGCENDYINKAIIFIKEISDKIKNRINILKEIQKYYALTINNMNSEIILINYYLDNIESIIKDEINDQNPIANCSSIRFDLLDFSHFMFEIIGYKLTIMLIFSSIGGMLGFILFYSLLLIINEIKNRNIFFMNSNYFDDSSVGNYLTNNKTNKTNNYRTIKPFKTLINNSEDDNEDNKKLLSDNDNKTNKILNKTQPKVINTNNTNDIKSKNPKVIYNNMRKIEMRYMK